VSDSAVQFLRLAGRARLDDDRVLIWSVAEGLRGRRWRATITDHGLQSVLLLEIAADGSPARLELATAAGMLTFHPEADRRSIHGNVVSADGVRPLALPWSPEHGLHAVRHPITAATIVFRLAASLAIGAVAEVPVVSIDDELRTRAGVCRVERQADGRWRLAADDHEMTLALSDDGVPRFDRAATDWPLEE
jgi:hypothetical protein